MEAKDLITINDYQRLSGLIKFAALETKMPDIVNSLLTKFNAARMLPQNRILSSVVTMNSRLLLKEVANDREAEVTITYPQDADSREGKISVFSPIGTALLGRQAGDIVSWKTPVGTSDFEIVRIIYQPEAVGHYYL
jgi:regulator of nucleoside diphosphate kinase